MCKRIAKVAFTKTSKEYEYRVFPEMEIKKDDYAVVMVEGQMKVVGVTEVIQLFSQRLFLLISLTFLTVFMKNWDTKADIQLLANVYRFSFKIIFNTLLLIYFV